MKLVSQGNLGLLTGVPNEADQPVRRVGRHVKPLLWWRRHSEEVDVWALLDGRRVEAKRRRPLDDWAVSWCTP
ncbi:hypothetical protein E7T06_07600 [Deinococcus sp. Arct2-2]|uniref:hypothetical protein n=1 Tax=Deinococcus sp. Arct2-2 TaxID=2568653 RepID=UPI0010A2DD4E|nr:hypothetical protein [Deinococcus sp. Arct2-2]THF70328.1 hypothetical protein E7T06_07600 [Deinococcus sp. Arct2-2]